MATVRQSITALYEEAQRSAVEGAPMLAVLQSDAAGPDALPDRADADGAIPLPVTAIAARFEELRRLAELEAGPAAEPSETPATEETRFDAPNDPLAGIDLSAGFGDRIRNDPADDATSAASDDVDGDVGVPPMDNNSSDIPVIKIPVTGFGAAPEDTGEPVPETPGDATPAAQAVTGIETGPSLPEEPPAPASDNTGDDLDIADIHTLVREAWEDETALGEIASPEAGAQSADHHAEAADIAATSVAATGNIETAMQEIAAAVVQSADSGQGIDVEAMKREIIAAMRAELQAVVDSDLKSVIKTAVAEAMADMPAVAPPAGQAAKKAPKAAPKMTRKAAPKAPAKKAAKAAAKAAAKTAPKKAAAKKKTANGKAVDYNES
ncbi:MAG: hypothetical protein ACPHIV_00400 [Candidatus Puniceispirillaceae bacterium]